MTTINIPTTPVSGGAHASTVRLMYLEHIPQRCTASSMQLFHRDGTADLRRPTDPGHVWDSHAAPTGDPVRIRPGDRLIVDGQTFEVHVPIGYDPIFPYLNRIDS